MTRTFELTISGPGDFPETVIAEMVQILQTRNQRAGSVCHFHRCTVDGVTVLDEVGRRPFVRKPKSAKAKPTDGSLCPHCVGRPCDGNPCTSGCCADPSATEAGRGP